MVSIWTIAAVWIIAPVSRFVQTIWSSVSLRTSIRDCLGFALPKHSSPSSWPLQLSHTPRWSNTPILLQDLNPHRPIPTMDATVEAVQDMLLKVEWGSRGGRASGKSDVKKHINNWFGTAPKTMASQNPGSSPRVHKTKSWRRLCYDTSHHRTLQRNQGNIVFDSHSLCVRGCWRRRRKKRRRGAESKNKTSKKGWGEKQTSNKHTHTPAQTTKHEEHRGT